MEVFNDRVLTEVSCPKCESIGTLMTDSVHKSYFRCSSCNTLFDTWQPPFGSDKLQAGVDYVLVLEDIYTGRTAGGLIIPDQSPSGVDFRSKRYQFTGVIVSIGRNVKERYDKLRPGDRIMYGRYARLQEFTYEGQSYAIVKGVPEKGKLKQSNEDGTPYFIHSTTLKILCKVIGQPETLDRGLGLTESVELRD